MGTIHVNSDGSYSRVIPVRLPEEVVEVYEAKAAADDLSVGSWIKKLLIELSGVESNNGKVGLPA
jgi:predicted HicB family RNase H-like nuclease